jgi:hypothetical protein
MMTFLMLLLLTGGLGVLFVVLAFVSDYAWPWIDALWYERNARPQARYYRRKP